MTLRLSFSRAILAVGWLCLPLAARGAIGPTPGASLPAFVVNGGRLTPSEINVLDRGRIVAKVMERLLLNRLVRNRIESRVAYFKQRLEGV